MCHLLNAPVFAGAAGKLSSRAFLVLDGTTVLQPAFQAQPRMAIEAAQGGVALLARLHPGGRGALWKTRRLFYKPRGLTIKAPSAGFSLQLLAGAAPRGG
jgi:hypothetical protein